MSQDLQDCVKPWYIARVLLYTRENRNVLVWPAIPYFLPDCAWQEVGDSRPD